VALALKSERPDLDVVGVDVDPDALDVARANGLHLGLEVEFVQSDLLAGLSGRRFDAVLANLPYVAADTALPPDVGCYEPARALFAGADGLDVIRRLVAQTGDVPLVALEVGFDQAEAVGALLAEAATAPATTVPSRTPLAPTPRTNAPAPTPRTNEPDPTPSTNSIEIVHDLAGHARVVVARR
jgi:release factor glutamine methyltransferase